MYHVSDKSIRILLDRYWVHDVIKITVFGVEIRNGCVILFDARCEQSKMAENELVAIDLS